MARSRILLFVFTIGIFSSSSWAENADLHSLAQSAGWRSLLHSFSSTSEIISPDFFLAADGNTNSVNELKATIEAFKNSNQKIGVLQQTAQCAFPARLEWLQRQGLTFPAQTCKDQKEFLDSLHPQSLTLVFSSAYPNNPASMFGHTMIRVNQGKNDPLLDYGVNYAAQVPEGEVGIKYLMKGLFGMYPGNYGILPFYQKVLEYNEAESRDLWEYDLTFTPAETLYWTKHLWELRFLAQFKYSFLERNCSYQIIRTLQVLRPEKKNWLPDNSAYTLPGETIRYLKQEQPELFHDVRYRPSHFKVLRSRYSSLNSDQQKEFKNSVDHRDTISQQKDAYVLETLNSYYEYLKIQQQENVDPEIQTLLRKIRVTRAKLGGVTQFPSLSNPGDRTNQPDLAHPTRRVAGTSHISTDQSFESGIRARLGLHELLNRDDGYEANFGVTGLDVELTWINSRTQKSRVHLRQVDLFDSISLQPITAGQYPLSWRIFSGWRPMLEQNELGENSDFQTGGGVGFTLEPVANHVWAGVFLNAGSHIDEVIPKAKWASLSVEPFILIRINSRTKVKFNFTAENDAQFSSSLATRSGAEFAWGIGKRFELRISDTWVSKSYVEKRAMNQANLEIGMFF